MLLLSSIRNKCRGEDKQLFMKEKSIKILKIHCLITNIEGYQKTYNRVLRKHKYRI